MRLMLLNDNVSNIFDERLVSLLFLRFNTPIDISWKAFSSIVDIMLSDRSRKT